VESALIEVSNTGRAESHLRSLIASAQEAFGIAELQYRQGVADLIVVLQAQQTLFSGEDQLAQTALANRLAYIHLYEALGGGWVEKPEERTQLAVTAIVQP
jgi:outer membrane protein TolC